MGEQAPGRARVIVRTEPLLDRSCAVCGRTFEGLARARYCSATCRRRADYQAHAAQRRQAKRAYRAARKGADRGP